MNFGSAAKMSFCIGTTPVLRLRVAELHCPEIHVCIQELLELYLPLTFSLPTQVHDRVNCCCRSSSSANLGFETTLKERNVLRAKPQLDLSNHLRDKIISDKLV